MRVLVASKFWYLRGGLERVLFDEIGLLEGAGHQVAAFSTSHPDNVTSPWSEHFVPYIELGASSEATSAEKARAAARMFYNPEAARRFAALVDEFKPDLVHIHGIHRQISPSILRVARARELPAVQTVHDYHHVCPADVLLRAGRTPCEPRSCRTLSYAAAITNRCVRGSVAASALSALETSFQRANGVYTHLARFICPSEFMAASLRAGGWKVPTTVLRNAVSAPADLRDASAAGDGFFYAGRLSPEKGVDVLLEAARRAQVRVTVAGTGPSEHDLRARFPEFDFLGHVDSRTIDEHLRRSRAAVVPSIWFENAPLSILEPMAAAVPVIASRIGGIPEMIDDGRDGVLVEPGDIESLAGAMRALAGDPQHTANLGTRARERVTRDNDPATHLDGLLAIYREALEGGVPS